MIRRPRLSVLLGIAIVTTCSFSGRSRSQAGPPQPEPAEEPVGILAETGMAHFRLVLGRLELDPPRHRKGSKSLQHAHPAAVEETVSVTSERGIPSLHYTLHSERQQVIIDVVDALRVRVVSERLDVEERFIIDQPASGPLTITCQRATETERLEAASFLHLQAALPQWCRRHLQPVWAYVMPGPTLAELSAATTDHLVAVTLSRSLPTQGDVLDWIDQLRSPRRHRRAAAERALLDYGLPVLRILDDVAPGVLDTEQAARLQRVRWTLRPRQADTPQRLASWLAADQAYWNLRAAELPPPQRWAIDRGLRKCLGEGLDEKWLHHDDIRIVEFDGASLR